MKPAKRISLVFLLLISFIGCEDKSEIELETLAKVYVDVLVVEDFYNNTDSLEIKRAKVFEKYTLTEAIYDSTFKKFSYDKEKWDTFFKLANTYLDTLKSDLKKSEKLLKSI